MRVAIFDMYGNRLPQDKQAQPAITLSLASAQVWATHVH